jgi:hypothetical protein
MTRKKKVETCIESITVILICSHMYQVALFACQHASSAKKPFEFSLKCFLDEDPVNAPGDGVKTGSLFTHRGGGFQRALRIWAVSFANQ